jgi:hypothetical protein
VEAWTCLQALVPVHKVIDSASAYAEIRFAVKVLEASLKIV